MTGEPQQPEVAVLLAVEHGGEVELHVGMAGEAGVVAQQAEPLAVADDGPEVLVAAVQELLHETVRRDPGGAGHAGSAPVDLDAGADEVHGHRPGPFVADRVVPTVEVQAAGR